MLCSYRPISLNLFHFTQNKANFFYRRWTLNLTFHSSDNTTNSSVFLLPLCTSYKSFIWFDSVTTIYSLLMLFKKKDRRKKKHPWQLRSCRGPINMSKLLDLIACLWWSTETHCREKNRGKLSFKVTHLWYILQVKKGALESCVSESDILSQYWHNISCQSKAVFPPSALEMPGETSWAQLASGFIVFLLWNKSQWVWWLLWRVS